MSTNFSLTSFVSYFSTHDELSVPANQELTISDIEEVLSDLTIYNAKGHSRAVLVIDRILSVLAKDSIIRIPNIASAELKSRVKPYLLLSCTEDMFIVARGQQTIVCPPGIFFRVMRSCKIFNVVFSPGQQMIFPLGKVEHVPGTMGERIALLNEKTPPNFLARLNCIGTYGSNKVSIGENVGISFYGDNITLELRKEPIQFASTIDFCKELEQQGKITLQPHQTLSVYIEDFHRILSFTNKYFPENRLEPHYWLNQIALLSGHLVAIKSIKDCVCTLKTQDSVLNISFSEEVSLSLQEGDLVVDLWWVGSQLARSGRPSIQIAKGKNLVIIDSPLEYFKQCSEANRGGLSEFLSYYNPLGFIWIMKGIREATDGKVGDIPVVILRPNPEESLIFSLKETTKEQFIMNTLQVMHPEVVEGLQEGDSNAIQLLLFNIMAYYLFSDFKVFCSDELPPYLKSDTSEEHPGTLQRMKTLRESEIFSEVVQKVLNNEGMYKQLYGILQMTPTAFHEINAEELESELKTVFLEMQQLVFTELQGSRLTQDALASVTRHFAEGNTIQHRPLIL